MHDHPSRSGQNSNNEKKDDSSSAKKDNTNNSSKKKSFSSLSKFILGTAGITAGLYAYKSLYPEGDVSRLLVGIPRFVRCLWVGVLISADYKLSMRGKDPESEEGLAEKARIHQRSAERMLHLALTNGGVYIKVGQYIASLNHIIPIQYCKTLAVLQDKAPWREFKDVVKIFEQDLGHPPSHFFSRFDEVPIAAASLAQVHKATTKEGNEVAVKVQYPDLAFNFDGDMITHEIILKLVKWGFPGFEFDWLGPDLKRVLVQELDFVKEANNAERTYRDLGHNKWIYVPKVYWDLTSKRIMTAEFIHGCKVNDIEGLKAMKLSPKDVVIKMIEVFSEQIFIHGFMHADPHPGNILVRPQPGRPSSAQLVLLDHGLYREFDDEFRRDYCYVFKSLVLRDERAVKEYSARLGIVNYKLFANLLLMRSFEGAAVGLGDKMSKEDVERMLSHLQSGMAEYVVLFRAMPRHILLILRNNNLLRSLNHELGVPANRFSIMARYAVQGLASFAPSSDRRPSFSHRFHAFKERLTFTAWLKAYELMYFLNRMAMRTLIRLRIIPNMEQVMLAAG